MGVSIRIGGRPPMGDVRGACRAWGSRVAPRACRPVPAEVRLCPSCAGRRMNGQTAVHLLDRDLPQVP